MHLCHRKEEIHSTKKKKEGIQVRILKGVSNVHLTFPTFYFLLKFLAN